MSNTDLSTLEKDKQTFIHSTYHEQLIIQRYENSLKMMNALEQGNAELTLSIINLWFDNIHQVNMLYSPEEENIQKRKMQLVSLNAIFHQSACRQNVPPLFLHILSRRFDTKIEQIDFSSVSYQDLVEEMVHEYCKLIRHSLTEHYAPFSDEVIYHLMSHITEPLSFDDLAEKMHVAPATLSRRFKAETGQTITFFLNNARIKLAKLYISEGTMNLTQIALCTGFNDASYFSKVFYKYTGMTPSEYAVQKM